MSFETTSIPTYWIGPGFGGSGLGIKLRTISAWVRPELNLRQPNPAIEIELPIEKLITPFSNECKCCFWKTIFSFWLMKR